MKVSNEIDAFIKKLKNAKNFNQSSEKKSEFKSKIIIIDGKIIDLNKNLELLGLSKNFSYHDVKNAYRKLAQMYHPDNKITGNSEKFREIKEAYEFLKEQL
ncbi:MAG: DnaJ domain-containing protein [Nanoarchaeota archaeon]|nr:DnaJ domain-containing protein [Nanoarchaeota archaeon]